MTKDTALKLAIEALELCDGNGLKDYDFCIAIHKCKTALNACKEALDTEQVREGEIPAQEPVAWRSEGGMLTEARLQAVSWVTHGGKATPLYTHPHQWQGLTDDEIGNAFHASISKEKYETGLSIGLFARAIEQALMDKNHG